MIYRLLKNFREVPPNYYRYVSPVTGNEIIRLNVQSWLDEAKADLLRNGHPIPIDLFQQMQDQLCGTLPPGWCDWDDPDRPRVDTHLTWGDVERGSATFVDWVSQGRPTVAADEAERRAKICASCYLNSRAVGCGQSCRELIRKLVGLFVSKKTSVDDRLYNCSACKCYLRAKVQFPLAIIEEHDTDSLQMLLPAFCWLKKSGQNYKP